LLDAPLPVSDLVGFTSGHIVNASTPERRGQGSLLLIYPIYSTFFNAASKKFPARFWMGFQCQYYWLYEYYSILIQYYWLYSLFTPSLDIYTRRIIVYTIHNTTNTTCTFLTFLISHFTHFDGSFT